MEATSNKKKIIQAFFPIALGIIIALSPRPEGLSPNAWNYLACFVAVICSVILEVLPMAVLGLAGIALISGLNILGVSPAATLTWALSGFANSVVWLVWAAMIFAVALKNTGIGKRIALWLIRIMGKTSLGLGYALAFADFILGPFMPSNTARSFGTIYPIAVSTAEALGSHPGPTAGRIGSFLLFTSFVATFVSSSTFLTAAAMSILGCQFIANASGLPILTWMEYLYGFIPQAVIIMAITPLIAYKFFTPEIKDFPEAPVWATEEMKKMGSLTGKEILTMFIFVAALIGWIFFHNTMAPAMTAFIAVVLMLIARVISWKEVLEEKSAWDTLVVLATLITLANGLNMVGFLKWLAKASSDWAGTLGLSVISILVILTLLDYVIHYLFVSITAHVTTLMPLWLAVAAGIPGFPVQLFGIVLIHTKEGYGALTPYGAGHGVGYMLSGYFPDHKQFWKAQSVWAYTYLVLMLASIPYWMWLYGYR